MTACGISPQKGSSPSKLKTLSASHAKDLMIGRGAFKNSDQTFTILSEKCIPGTILESDNRINHMDESEMESMTEVYSSDMNAHQSYRFNRGRSYAGVDLLLFGGQAEKRWDYKSADIANNDNIHYSYSYRYRKHFHSFLTDPQQKFAKRHLTYGEFKKICGTHFVKESMTGYSASGIFDWNAKVRHELVDKKEQVILKLKFWFVSFTKTLKDEHQAVDFSTFQRQNSFNIQESSSHDKHYDGGYARDYLNRNLDQSFASYLWTCHFKLPSQTCTRICNMALANLADFDHRGIRPTTYRSAADCSPEVLEGADEKVKNRTMQLFQALVQKELFFKFTRTIAAKGPEYLGEFLLSTEPYPSSRLRADLKPAFKLIDGEDDHRVATKPKSKAVEPGEPFVTLNLPQENFGIDHEIARDYQVKIKFKTPEATNSAEIRINGNLIRAPKINTPSQGNTLNETIFTLKNLDTSKDLTIDLMMNRRNQSPLPVNVYYLSMKALKESN